MSRTFKTILMALISSSLVPFVTAQTTSGTKVPGSAISRLPLGPQELAGGFWRADHDFKPTLQITNVLSIAPLTVTPVLYMADGTPYSLGPYKLAASGVVAIDLRNALEEAPAAIVPHMSDHGSVRIQYEWHWANAITASVQNIDAPRSLNFTFELRTPPAAKDPSTTSVKQEKHGGMSHSKHDAVRNIIEEGLWWKRDLGVEGFVALTNISANALPVSLELLGSHGQVSARKRLTLGPEITRVLQLSDLDPEKLIHAKAGGVRIQYTGTTHDLVVVGGLEDGNEGYSANIPFGILPDKPNPANPVSISAAGIMVGAPDPMMMFPAGTVFTPYVAMRNTSSRTLLVSSSISFMEGSTAKTVPIAPIKLRAGESREVNANDLLARAGLANFNGSINLGFFFNGDGNDLLLATGSVDQKGTYVLPVEATGNGESESKWLKYWSVANGDDTMISLFNPAHKPEDLQMTLFFMDGQYKVPIHLDPKGSTMLMLGEIITSHKPDSDGHTIPFFIRHGSAILSGTSGMGDLINVSVSSSVFNVANATCGSTCPTCLGIVDFSVSPSSTSTNIGGTLNYTATETNTSGGKTDVTTRSSWSSTNTTVGSLQSAGAYQGMSPGTFGAVAQLQVISPNPDCPEGQHNPCPTDPGQGSGGGSVTPTVTISCSNMDLSLGTTAPSSTTSGNCTAQGNPSGGSFSWTASATTINLSPSGASAQYTSANPSSSSGDTNIKVTYTVNSQSASASSSGLTVHKPTSLQAGTVQATGTAPCTLPCLTNPGDGTCNATPGTSCTYSATQFQRQYTVLDQFGASFETAGIDAVAVTEAVSLTSNNCGGSSITKGSATAAVFADTFGKCDTCCQQGGPGCTTSAAQTISVNGLPVRNTTITETCTATTVTP